MFSTKNAAIRDKATTSEPATDRELLARFLVGDEAAFSEVVRRYTRLVIDVCQRILRHRADAEDAFQATFLVLARKAGSLEWQDSIAGWLHQTARRTSLKLRAMSVRRRDVENQAAHQRTVGAETQTTDPTSQVDIRELGEILDAELAAIPARFREVVLLSQVEGLTRDEVAERLGISVPTVKDRLERGRELLRSRLLRRGITFTSAALAAWLIPATAQAGNLATLATATSQAASSFATGSLMTGASPTAATLAQGVLNMMGFEKLKSATIWVVSFLTAGGIAFGMLRDDPHRFEKGLVGQIVEVNRNGATPTITIHLDEFETLLNLDIAADARVWEAYELAKLDDVRSGRRASLRLAGDHRKVAEIHLQGTVREVTIRSVTESGRVTFVDTEDDEAQKAPQAADLADDAILRIGGLPAGRGELKPGMEVPIEFSGDGQHINAIETSAEDGALAWGELVEGLNSSSQIRFRGEDGDDVERVMSATISGETLVTLDGKPAKIGDLPVRSQLVIRWSTDKTTAAAIQAKSPEVDADDDN